MTSGGVPSPTVQVARQSDSLSQLSLATKRQVSTVGRIQPHLECKIVDEAGNVVPAGEQGELCTRGYSVMKGYWDKPEETAAAIYQIYTRFHDEGEPEET